MARLSAVRAEPTADDDDTGAHHPPIPPPPAWLSTAAREVWQRLAPHVPPGTLTEASADLFGITCTTMATYTEADGIVESAGLLIAAGQDLVPNPALAIRTTADAGIARWARVFGLIPDTTTNTTPKPGTGPKRIPRYVVET